MNLYDYEYKCVVMHYKSNYRNRMRKLQGMLLTTRLGGPG